MSAGRWQRRREIPTVFTRGVDRGSDPKIVQQALLRAENVVTTRRGALQKRTGSIDLDGSFPDEQNLVTHRGTPVLYGERLRVFAGSDPESGGFDLPGSRFAESTIQPTDIDIEGFRSLGVTKIVRAEVAEASDVRAVICTDYDGSTCRVLLQVFRLGSGVLLDSEVLNSTGGVTGVPFGRLSVNDAGELLYWYCNASAELIVGEINTTTGEIQAEASTPVIAALKSANVDFDVCALGGTNDRFMVVAIDSSDDIAIEIVDWAGSGTYSANGTTISAVAVTCGCFKRQDGEGVALWSTSANVRLIGYDDGLVNTVTTTDWVASYVTHVGGVALDASLLYIVWTRYHASLNEAPRIDTCDVSVSGSTGTPSAVSVFAYSATLISKPFMDDLPYPSSPEVDGNLLAVIAPVNRIYSSWLPIAESPEQDTFLVYRGARRAASAGAALAIGQCLRGYAVPYTPGSTLGWNLVTPQLLAENQWALALVKTTDYKREHTTVVRSLIDREPDSIPALEGPRNLLIGGSLPCEFDGKQVYEQGFLQYPLVSAATSGSGTVLETGNYAWKAIYRWVDADGKIHRSAPSVASDELSITNGAAIPTIAITSLRWARRVDVAIDLYRTLVDGSDYYKVATLENDPYSDYITHQDIATDASIAENEPLYTDDGSLAAMPPPPYRIATEWQQRQFVVDRENEATRGRYSLQAIPNEEWQHAEELELRWPAAGGDVIALANITVQLADLGDRLVIFKRTRIYATDGAGLNQVGVGSGYAEPYLVSPGVGCIERRSVVRSPLGVLFLSEDGIYLLTRSMELKPVGERVMWWTRNRTIVAANLIEARNLVVFTSSDGEALVWNYLYDVWTTWDDNFLGVSACVAGDRLYWKKGNAVWVEARSSYLDKAAAYQLVVDTGWMLFAGLEGFHRFWEAILVGQALGAHYLQIKIAYDLDPTWVDTILLDLSNANFDDDAVFDIDAHYSPQDLVEAQPFDAYVAKFRGSRTKCSAIRFQFSDVSADDPDGDNAAPNAALSLTGITYLIGMIGGLDRVQYPRRN